MRTFFALIAIVAAGIIVAWTRQSWSPSPQPNGNDGGELAVASSSTEGDPPRVGTNETGLPLSLPAGFSIAVFAEDLSDARVLALDRSGNVWVSRPSEGTVSVLEMENGTVRRIVAALSGLNRPHGLAFDPRDNRTLFIAEETRIIAVDTEDPAQRRMIHALPAGGRHRTRSLAFGADGRLYVSIGSTCDTCVEADDRHGSVLSLEPDGSDAKTVAAGLRNAVFITRGPDGNIWATEMGRDFLGDALPPDEVNVIAEGGRYGWPFCYGNRVRDGTFRPQEAFDCAQTVPPAAELPAHGAPLGLAFIPDSWPAAMRGDLLVALHGSWNSSQPVGYTIVRIPLDANGKQEGPVQDFVSGWLQPNGTILGRPAGLLFLPDGSLLVTDDREGTVFRITPP
ncbi:MAG: PQQ-dependent sugar dehydrogenase [Candidatus Peribacteraceae bacterium]|jgi:glucose/arabinose dehydrogenase